MELVSHDDRATGNGLAMRRMPMVLMYHSVQPYTEDPYLVTVRRAALRAADVLAAPARAARGVDRRTARGAGRGAGRGLVGLSFDDGYADFAEYALPVLRRYGFTATVFVIAGRMGGDNVWDPAGPRKPLLDADQVAGLAEAGVEIGSHGLMHVSLPAAHRALAAETGGSRRILQDVTGQPAGGFCYPYGHLDAEVVGAVRDAGYDYGCAIWPSEHAGRHALPRTFIGDADSSPRLWAKAMRHRLARARAA